MKVALYHPWVYLMSGIERMLVEVLARSRHDWTIYTHHHEPEATYPELRAARIVELSPRVSVRRELRPLAHAAATMARCRLPTMEERALLVSSEGLGDLVMARARLPAVCYCHTPLKIVHDPVTRAALVAHDRRKQVLAAALAPAFNAADRLVWRRYRHVLANSDETARRIAAAGLAERDRVEVLRPGVDLARFGAGQDAARRRRFLVAGRIMWQKNVELAIDALALARRRGLDCDLVIAGAVDVKSRPYLAELRARARGLPVTFEPDPTDERLVELYGEALALVFTPLNEDWGMVPLEAMAAGALVIAVDAGGPRESILHGKTGWLLPGTPAAFAERMLEVASTDATVLAPLRSSARSRAAEFGWDGFVARLDDVMEAVAR